MPCDALILLFLYFHLWHFLFCCRFLLFTFHYYYFWQMINGPNFMVLLFVDTVNNKTMLFIPEAFDPLTDTTNYPLTRILYSLSPKMHAIYLFPKVFCAFNCQKGIFQFKHCYCTELFSSGINLIITEQQCTNKFNNEIF